MSTPFQNRLVGTIIVAAVAIIFLPDLLDGDKKSYQAKFEQIPTPPPVPQNVTDREFPKEKLALGKNEEILADITPQDNLLTDTENSSNSTDVSTEKTNNNSSSKVNVSTLPKVKPIKVDDDKKNTRQKTLPEKAISKQAWVIQLGSFKHKKNVADLVNKLKKAGYTAFTKPIKTKNGTLTKVFVGPEFIKSSLEKKIPKLKKLTQVEGKVARYSPTNQ